MGAVEGRRWLLYANNLINMRQLLDHVSNSRKQPETGFLWFRLQNSITLNDIDLKFYMGVVFEKLEDVVHVFLPGTVHK
jgi:hypothetical protein